MLSSPLFPFFSDFFMQRKIWSRPQVPNQFSNIYQQLATQKACLMCFSAISYKHFLCFFFIIIIIIIIIIFFLANTGSSCQMRKVNITITSEVWNNTLLESESSEFRTLETSVLRVVSCFNIQAIIFLWNIFVK